MTLGEFKEKVRKESFVRVFDGERDGQAVFNYIEDKYKVARQVQFLDHIDCFFDDDQTDAFLEASYRRIFNHEDI